MTETGFLAKRRHSPVSLGAAVAVQGLILAGLLSMAPKIVPGVLRDSIPTIDIWTPPTPQPEPVEPPTIPKQPESRIDTVPTIVPTRPSDIRIVLPDLPPIDPGAGTGVAPQPPVTLDPPRPEPVLVEAQVDPRYARQLQPDYPGSMTRQGVEGKVTVRVLIGTDGRVKTIEQVASDAPAFFEATREQALKRWRFKPATRDGVPVESWRTMTVRFQLAD